ncbi:hypothetical protein [Roseomonas haemaphysalidis]|jgi:hypothetical protein|uniref:Uncharacterized protein n=1 Tax=Roseomonas haemaphysalidis TaxID=2768162 RepID=A0ABS3KSY1_9PROT|nr:hypothetical protein [Roseomonas haemaphysalidis]MBO1080524.1 hypothetical protein [Roseomonas haemaphysalidis]
MPQTGWVLLHQGLGLYVGRSPALSYWSKLNGAGRVAVATFPTEAKARWHVDLWEGGWPEDHDRAGLSLHPVVVDLPDGWASLTAIRAAGLGEHLGELAHQGWRAAPGQC